MSEVDPNRAGRDVRALLAENEAWQRAVHRARAMLTLLREDLEDVVARFGVDLADQLRQVDEAFRALNPEKNHEN